MPTPALATVDDTARIIMYAEGMAKHFGLKLERPSDATKTAILGRWNMEDIGEQKGCGGGEFFREFRDDGYAYAEVCATSSCSGMVLGDRARYAIKEKFIEIQGRSDTEPGFIIFQMSGNFYLPSHECFLVKLVKPK